MFHKEAYNWDVVSVRKQVSVCVCLFLSLYLCLSLCSLLASYENFSFITMELYKSPSSVVENSLQ